MRDVLRQRPLKLLFTANFVSLLGSGMNAAGLSWYVLQTTHSEISLGTLMLLQTLPMLLLAPVTGVITDRNDRRYLCLALDALRAAVIAAVALLCLAHRAELWHLYAMNMLVAGATGMFWPAMLALVQELTPETNFPAANTLLMVGVNAGFMAAGTLVGMAYNQLGLGGVLLIDVASYLVSFACFWLIRRGRHLVAQPSRTGGAWELFAADTADCFRYLRDNRFVVLLCTSSAVLFAAMFAMNVLIPPLADRILHAGAVGYGWINAAWSVGAFISAGLAPWAMRRFGIKRSVAAALALLTLGSLAAPQWHVLRAALAIFLLMGAARGIGVVASNTGLMQVVPKNYMGRVQNTFAIAARAVQMALGMAFGWVAHVRGLMLAFALLAATYGVGALAAALAGTPKTSAATPGARTAAAP